MRSRQGGGEDEVGQARGEAEAGAEAQRDGDGGEDAVERGVHHVQREREEHERELERLGHAAQHRADGSGANQADGGLALGGLGGLDHRDGSAGDTEHHAREEAGHVHADGPVDHGAVGHGVALHERAPVRGQIAQADGVKPEHVVQRVMQTGRDQQAVEEGVDAGAHRAHALDAVADGNQHAEDHRPDEQQDRGDDDGDHAGHDSDGALAGEEGQHVRQLGALELVVAGGADDAGEDAGERVGDLGERNGVDRISDHTRGDGAHGAGGQQRGHHQPGNQTGQAGGTVVLLGQADGHADGEQKRHIVNQRRAGLHEEEAEHIRKALGRTGRAHDGGSQRITDAHQNAADRQTGNRQHQRAAQFLQFTHHK